MNDQNPKRCDQAALWNGVGSQGWIASQDLLDHVFQPFDELLADAVSCQTNGHVLDVGCGTGSTTVAVARRLGTSGRCTGIDIAEPMIAAARARAEREDATITFIVANAQTYPFEPDSYDTFISRFGVMFFDDSAQAFANLRRAAKIGAALRCVVWRSATENTFMTAAERAAAPLLPGLPARRANDPGQFAFAERDRVRGILLESGWSGIDIQPIDIPCVMPESALTRYFTQLGPVGRILQRADPDLRARVVGTVRPAFEQYVHGGEVRFTAACWLIGASA